MSRNKMLTALAAVLMSASVALVATTPAQAGSEWEAKTQAAGPVKPHTPPVKPMRGANGRYSVLAGAAHHAGFYQDIASPGTDGVAMLMSQHKPSLPASENVHSLGEVLIQSADFQQTVEVGWRVYPGDYGDSNPHLFAARWTNGAFGGYAVLDAGSGWQDNPSEAVNAGTSLAYTASGVAPTVFYNYQIKRQTANFWSPFAANPGWRIIQKNAGAADRVIGVFPDTLWTAPAFTKARSIQGYVEVNSLTTPTSCADEGSGVFGTSTSPSAATELKAYSHFSPPAGVTNVPDGTFAEGSPTAYRLWHDPADADRFKVGGPGWNAAGTGTGSIGSC